MAAGEPNVPKFAVVTDDDRRFVMETRGSRYAGFAIFMVVAAVFLIPFFVAEAVGTRIAAGLIGWPTLALALYVLATAECWEVDKSTGTIVYDRRFRPGSMVRFTRADIAASQIASRTTRGLSSDSRGRSHRRSTSWHSLFVYLRDGRRFELNVSADLAFIERVHEAVLGAPPPEPVPYSWYRHPWLQALDRVIAPVRASRGGRRSAEAAAPAGEEEQIGPHRVSEWIERLGSAGADDRHDAAMALSMTRKPDKRPLPALVRLLDDPETRVRRVVIQAIRHLGVSPEAVPALIRVLGNPAEEPAIRAAAAGALDAAGREAAEAAAATLREALAHPDPNLRFRAASALFAHGAPADEAVMRAFTAGFEVPETRALAASRLASIGRPARAAVPALIAMLADQKAENRVEAANALARMREYARAAVPALVARLSDPEVQCRKAALRALESIGPDASAAVPALIAALEDPDQWCRRHAVDALGSIGPGALAAVPSLVSMLQHPDEWCRHGAIQALGRMGPGASEAVPALRRLVDHVNLTAGLLARHALESIEGVKHA